MAMVQIPVETALGYPAYSLVFCYSHRRHSFYFIYGRRVEVRPQFRIRLLLDNNYTLAMQPLKKAAILKRNLLIIYLLFSLRVTFLFFSLDKKGEQNTMDTVL